MTLIRYGTILVSSGVIITGALLWDSGNRRALAETEAELLAATVERSEIAYLTGTNLPAFLSSSNNVITTRREWSVFYTKTLCTARDLTTNNTGSILWLDPSATITNGQILADSGGSWIATEGASGIYAVTFSGATNATAAAHSTGSHLPDPSSEYMPGVTTNPVAPVIDALFSSASYATNALFAGICNTWWQRIGIDTNIYKYACEEYTYNYFESVIIKYESGGSTDKDSLFFTTSDWDTPQTITVSALASGSAVAYKIIEPDNTSNGVFGVSAIPPHPLSSENGIRVKDGAAVTTMFEIDAGTNTINISFFNVFNYVPARADKTVSFSYAGDVTGPSSIALSAGTPTVYVDFACPEGGCGVINAVTTPTDSGYFPPFAMSVINEHPAAYYTVIPTATFNPASTTAINISLSAQPEEATATMHTSQRLLTNNLLQARTVLTNLTRTVALLDPSDIAYGQWITRKYYGGTNDNSSTYDTYTFSEALAWHNANAPVPDIYNPPITNTSPYDGQLLVAEIDLRTANYHLSGSDYSEWSGDQYFEFDSLTNCTLPYPSTYAITNGCVSRLRAYICAAPLIDDRTHWTAPTNYITYAGPSHQPWLYDSYTYGSTNLTYLSTRNDGSAGFPADGFSTPRYTWSNGAGSLLRYRLIQIIDISDPATVPTFSLGGDLPDYTITLTAKTDFDATEHTYYDPSPNTTALGYYRHLNRIDIKKIIVIVDWSWQHLNPAAPYQPTTNTPPWTI